MKGRKLLQEIRLANMLSCGPKGVTLVMEPLNVLIGPNASGKSNLISAVGLLAAAPKDLRKFLREEGGAQEWGYKGEAGPELFPSVEVKVFYARSILRYKLDLVIDVEDNLAYVQQEILAKNDEDLYNREAGLILQRGQKSRVNRRLPSDIQEEQSILSQIKDPGSYVELTWIGRQFNNFRFFRDWNLGRGSAARRPQPADLPADFLLPDASNLGLVLSDLTNRHPQVMRRIIELLRSLYDRVRDLTIHVQGGTVQVFVHEEGLSKAIPASRLSDGTLLFLCLLAILCHPSPPNLVCIEEPEIGLHPDAIHLIAELLVEAATRTQLVVTTHSDMLVSALSEVPEAVVVCERTEGGTSFRRLERNKLTEWLERYRLGELWLMGEIGGTRW